METPQLLATDSKPSTLRAKLVQGSHAPILRLSGTGAFLCTACDKVLIESYDPRCAIGLDLECFDCHTVSRTPSWPIGEPRPVKLIALQGGRLIFEATAEMDGGHAALTCSEELAQMDEAAGIRLTSEPGFTSTPSTILNLTPAGLDLLEARLRAICSGFDQALAKAKRAESRGNYRLLNCLPAWALLQLRRSLENKLFDLDSDDGVAITYLQALFHVTKRWEHHEQFPSFSSAFLSEFEHAITLLIAASYLAEEGNPIGFTPLEKNSGRSADMYINVGPNSRINIEVKTPKELRWPNQSSSIDRILRAIENSLKSAKGQITSKEGGLVVIGCSIPTPDFSKLMEVCIDDLLARGRVSSRIGAIVVVCLTPVPKIESHSGYPITTVMTQNSSQIFAKVNPKFTGPPLLRQQ